MTRRSLFALLSAPLLAGLAACKSPFPVAPEVANVRRAVFVGAEAANLWASRIETLSQADADVIIAYEDYPLRWSGTDSEREPK